VSDAYVPEKEAKADVEHMLTQDAGPTTMWAALRDADLSSDIRIPLQSKYTAWAMRLAEERGVTQADLGPEGWVEALLKAVDEENEAREATGEPGVGYDAVLNAVRDALIEKGYTSQIPDEGDDEPEVVVPDFAEDWSIDDGYPDTRRQELFEMLTETPEHFKDTESATRILTEIDLMRRVPLMHQMAHGVSGSFGFYGNGDRGLALQTGITMDRDVMNHEVGGHGLHMAYGYGWAHERDVATEYNGDGEAPTYNTDDPEPLLLTREHAAAQGSWYATEGEDAPPDVKALIDTVNESFARAFEAVNEDPDNRHEYHPGRVYGLVNAAEFMAVSHSSFQTDNLSRALTFATNMKENFPDLYDAYTKIYNPSEKFEMAWEAVNSGEDVETEDEE
jgi:hypothetical protein